MYAVTQLLRLHNLSERFTAAFFAENDNVLAGAVEAYWRRKTDEHGGPRYTRIATDVWQILREGTRLLQQICEAAPNNAMLLIIAGSPCQQNCTFGDGKGHIGLCGDQSFNYFCVPIIASLATKLRPDLLVEVLNETAGSTRPPHRAVIARTLGIPFSHMSNVDSKAWSHCGRSRMLASTIGPPATYDLPPMPQPPWDAGWIYKGRRMCAWMRGRGPRGRANIVSTYQVLPEYLLYKADTWGNLSLTQARKRIREILPMEHRKGWDLLWKTRASGDNEAGCLAVAQWICEHGAEHGFRPPNVTERARTFGIEEYMNQLGLDPWDAFNALGNAFDGVGIIARIGKGIIERLNDSNADKHAYPGIDTVFRCFDEIRQYTITAGYHARGSPIPEDLSDLPRYAASLDGSGNQSNNPRRLFDESPQDEPAQLFGDNRERALPANFAPRRGYSGGHPRIDERNICVVDSYCQITGSKRAFTSEAQAARVACIASEIRNQCNIHLGGMLPTGQSWTYYCAMHFGTGQPRPHLAEIVVRPSGNFKGEHIVLHGSRRPWNGRIAGIASNGVHTEPLWWNTIGNDGNIDPDIPAAATIRVANFEAPPIAHCGANLPLTLMLAIGHGYRVRWNTTYNGQHDAILHEAAQQAGIAISDIRIAYGTHHSGIPCPILRRIPEAQQGAHPHIGVIYAPHDPTDNVERNRTQEFPGLVAYGAKAANDAHAPAVLVCIGPAEYPEPILVCTRRRDGSGYGVGRHTSQAATAANV